MSILRLGKRRTIPLQQGIKRGPLTPRHPTSADLARVDHIGGANEMLRKQLSLGLMNVETDHRHKFYCPRHHLCVDLLP